MTLSCYTEQHMACPRWGDSLATRPPLNTQGFEYDSHLPHEQNFGFQLQRRINFIGQEMDKYVLWKKHLTGNASAFGVKGARFLC